MWLQVLTDKAFGIAGWDKCVVRRRMVQVRGSSVIEEERDAAICFSKRRDMSTMDNAAVVRLWLVLQ
jgi:hypothetical protein